MEEIRAFSEEHVRDAANLFLSSGRGQNRPAPQALQDVFREIFLGNPWVAEDIQSLVYIENGKLVGFLGVIPRPMEFRGRPIRVATIYMWLVDHQLHRGLAGMKLLRQALNGPQDFSLTDGPGNEASSIYTAVGAKVSPLYSFNWVRVLHPFQTGRGVFDRMGGFFPKLKGPAGAITGPLDFLVSKLPLGVLKRPKSPFSSKQVSAAEFLECMQEGRGREALRPLYSMPSFGWLMAQASKSEGHEGLRLMTVQNPDGARCGWFAYWSNPGLPAYVIQLGCHRKGQFTEVLLALFEDAWEQGASAVKGQAIPQYLIPLTEQFCLFRQPYGNVIGHSRDPEILQAFLAGDAAISRFDAGAWVPLRGAWK
ncbi:MAG TPA: hypothetical protein VGG72_33395 [Bryobacteraceae bacterium]|jgi:hypothetical protein